MTLALRDTLVLAGRQLTHWRMQPGQVVFALVFPIIFILLFGYVFGSGMQSPDGGDYLDFLIPGMFVSTLAWGIAETATGMNVDAKRGVTDRLRAMPLSAVAIVAGRTVADMVNAVAGLVVMVACGLAVGWRWHEGLGDALLAFGLLLWLRFALQWVGVFLGLLVRTEEGIAALQGLLFPITILTSAYVAPSLMPGWLGTIAAWNPLSSTVAATRELFGNPTWPADSWVERHAIELAVLWPLVLLVAFAPLAARRWRRLSR